MKFATLLTPSSVYMSRTPFSKIPQWAQWLYKLGAQLGKKTYWIKYSCAHRPAAVKAKLRCFCHFWKRMYENIKQKNNNKIFFFFFFFFVLSNHKWKKNRTLLYMNAIHAPYITSFVFCLFYFTYFFSFMVRWNENKKKNKMLYQLICSRIWWSHLLYI